ncbi:MAG: ABC transporter permease [Halanaerobium sp.]|nr:ABC transporter permease [Halanaerobium sp.]
MKHNKLFDSFLVPVLSIVIALIIGSIIMFATGYNPLEVYKVMIIGAVGSVPGLANTLANAVPLILAGVGVAIAFNSGLFNIGAEGQYMIGALVGAWAGYTFQGLPWFIHIPLVLLLAMVAGGLWGGVIPGLAKAFTGAHEVITTMMMSYIAVFLSHYLLRGGPMQAPGYVPQSPRINPSAILPLLVPRTQLSAGIFIAVIVPIVCYFLVYKTKWGLSMRIVGKSIETAKYVGIIVPKTIVVSMGLSGAFAGLAGAVQIMGIQHRMVDSFSSGYGYTAIVVALLARNNPIGVIFAALVFAILGTGSQFIQINLGVSAQIADIISGLIIFFIAVEKIIKVGFSYLKKSQAENRGVNG